MSCDVPSQLTRPGKEPPEGVPSPKKQVTPSPQSSKMASINGKLNQAQDDDDFGDFGDFGEANDAFEEVDFGDFATPSKPAVSKEQNLMDFDAVPLPSRPTAGTRTHGFFAVSAPPPGPRTKPGEWYETYKRRHVRLLPQCLHLRNSPSPSTALSLLFAPDPKTALVPSLSEQGDLLLALLRFLSPEIQPVNDWGFLRQSLLAAADRFDSTCLVAFEMADSKKDIEGMQAAADASWKVWQSGGGRREEWECGRVWIEKRNVFYETGKWDAAENIM